MEEGISHIENMAMTRYLMYKHKVLNMENKRLPVIASKSSQNHMWLNQGWHNDVNSCLNHWRIEEEFTM